MEIRNKTTPKIMKEWPSTGTSAFLLTKLEHPERLAEMGALRVAAWKEEQGISQDFFANAAWIDDDDQKAHHWIITKDNIIVAAARMSFHKEYKTVPHADLFDENELGNLNAGPFASLNRLVVAPAFRGHGFSAWLDKARINYAEANGVKLIIAQPIASRIKPLEDLGFIYIGKIRPLYQMPDRQIYFMIKELPQNI